MVIGVLSLPLVWGLLQTYQTGLVRPAGQALADRWRLFDALAPSPATAPLLASSLLSLCIWGTCAFLWPELGFGRDWTASRSQGLVVLGLAAASTLYPLVNRVVGYTTPVSEMGYIIWTITPVQEEILFRGFLYRAALRLFGITEQAPWRAAAPALLTASLWFAVWHATPYGIEKYGLSVIAPQVALTFGAGLLLNWLRHWTRSIWLLIPVHAIGNFMLSIM